MVFLESLLFTSKIYDVLDDDEDAALQEYLGEYPESGVIVRGSKGLCKVRWATQGKGKSGGARVIYYWHVSESQILMIDIYSNSE